MTEDEAKTKWCPLTRHLAVNLDDGLQVSECLGSECMMWQWIGTATESISTSGPDIPHVPRPEGEGWLRTNSSEDGKLITGSNGEGDPYHQVWTRPRPDGTRSGVCGLVNK